MNAYEQYYKLAELRVLLHICRSFWGPYELKEDCGSYGLVPGLMAVFENGISVEGEGAGGLLKNLDEVIVKEYQGSIGK